MYETTKRERERERESREKGEENKIETIQAFLRNQMCALFLHDDLNSDLADLGVLGVGGGAMATLRSGLEVSLGLGKGLCDGLGGGSRAGGLGGASGAGGGRVGRGRGRGDDDGAPELVGEGGGGVGGEELVGGVLKEGARD